jgi:hypothetical protein
MTTMSFKRSKRRRVAVIILCFLVLQVSAFASSFRPLVRAKRGSSVQHPTRTFTATTEASSSSSDDSKPDHHAEVQKVQEEEEEDPLRGGASGGRLSAKKIPSLPGLEQYRKFALPCLGLWVAGPLLSLVDTSFVGLSGSPEQSARQLAALGPATTL